MQIENFGTLPLPSVVKAYIYQQYFDDPDLQSYFAAHNSEAQGYLDWFNNTPLGVYTNPNISGLLLDWVGLGVYGIARPVISTLTRSGSSFYNSAPYNTLPVNGITETQSGSAQIASDDIYKRVLTWHEYTGDGHQMSIEWLRRRVARFLWGLNGTDIPVDYTWQVRIDAPPGSMSGAYISPPYNTAPYNANSRQITLAARSIQIGIPPMNVSQQFKELLEQGYLALPFQVYFSVLISA